MGKVVPDDAAGLIQQAEKIRISALTYIERIQGTR